VPWLPVWVLPLIVCVIWLATDAGGLALGAILAAIAVKFMSTPFAAVGLAPYWLFALGGLFVLVTLLLPRGVVGTVQHWWDERREKNAARIVRSEPAEPAPKPALKPAE
jgi:urea transport system permease protein